MRHRIKGEVKVLEFKKTDNHWTNGISFENAEVGDTFSHVAYGQWSTCPVSAFDMKVIRAGKRDIICVPVNSSNGSAETKFSRKDRASSCYPIGHEKVTEARTEIRRRIRIRNCRVILEKAVFDDELMDAIEAFANRVKTE
jgi:hypothetical protein